MTTKLTKAEVRTIETILKNGGKVTASMGRIKAGVVNKLCIERLQARGLLTFGDYGNGAVKVDITVTAEGCNAFNSNFIAKASLGKD